MAFNRQIRTVRQQLDSAIDSCIKATKTAENEDVAWHLELAREEMVKAKNHLVNAEES